MATNANIQLPSPPTFSQLMEDLEMMSSDDKIFKLFQLEQLAEQAEKYATTSTKRNDEETTEETYIFINRFLSKLESLKCLDTSLTTQNDSTNDQIENKLKDIIDQLQMCLNKLQKNSFSNSNYSVVSNNKIS